MLVADGYVAWTKPEDPKAPRQPFHFQVDGGELFAFAALWTRAKVEDEWVRSVTLLTTNATDAVKPIHNRMPVILPGRDEEDLWLHGQLDDVLLRPIDASRVTLPGGEPGAEQGRRRPGRAAAASRAVIDERKAIATDRKTVGRRQSANDSTRSGTGDYGPCCRYVLSDASWIAALAGIGLLGTGVGSVVLRTRAESRERRDVERSLSEVEPPLE